MRFQPLSRLSSQWQVWVTLLAVCGLWWATPQVGRAEGEYARLLEIVGTDTGRIKQTIDTFDSDISAALQATPPDYAAIQQRCTAFSTDAEAFKAQLNQSATQVTNLLKAVQQDPAYAENRKAGVAIDAITSNFSTSQRRVENRLVMAGIIWRAAFLGIETDSITPASTVKNLVDQEKRLAGKNAHAGQLRREWRSIGGSSAANLAGPVDAFITAITDRYQENSRPLRIERFNQGKISQQQYDAAKAIAGPVWFGADNRLQDRLGYNLTDDLIAWDLPVANAFGQGTRAEFVVYDTVSKAPIYRFFDAQGYDISNFVLGWSSYLKKSKITPDRLVVSGDGATGYAARIQPAAKSTAKPVDAPAAKPVDVSALIKSVLGQLPKASSTNLFRPYEWPYKAPAAGHIIKAGGKVLDFNQLPPMPAPMDGLSQKYLWVLREDGEIWIAAECQLGRSGIEPERLIKHRDLAMKSSSDPKKIAPARIGGELWYESDATNPAEGRWVLNNDSSYSFKTIRLDGEDCLKPEYLQSIVNLLRLYGCQSVKTIEIRSK